ncbi:AraC family transcriptional regulator [Puteibacter caeruleilacunae]|nr:AraC family transcriptional regulator [Puteibacter caeruleilacunae]
MKEFIDFMPLVGSIVGFLLAAFVLLNAKTQSNKSRFLLTFIILFISYSLLESYWAYTDPKLYYTYFIYNLVGLFYLLYVRNLLRLKINLKWIVIVLCGYTLIHSAALIWTYDLILDLTNYKPENDLKYLVLSIDYFVILACNLWTVIYAYKKIKDIPLEKVVPKERINIIWSKKIIRAASAIYLLLMVGFFSLVIVSVLNGSWFTGDDDASIFFVSTNFILFYDGIEVLLTSSFIFTIGVWAIRIPVFSPYLEEIGGIAKPEPQKKYARSTLKEDESEYIWSSLKQLMEEEKVYRNPLLRLNDVAEKLNSPLPHVSQVINEQQGLNFLDYVNQYRVEEAKQLLVSEESKSLTILAIAYEVGFNSKTAFYTSFKKVTNMTPSEYKKNA